MAAKPAKSDEMAKNTQFTRIAFIDKEAVAALSRIADVEGRPQQRQLGIMLERLAHIYRENPEKLLELDLISRFAMPHRRHAVA